MRTELTLRAEIHRVETELGVLKAENNSPTYTDRMNVRIAELKLTMLKAELHQLETHNKIYCISSKGVLK